MMSIISTYGADKSDILYRRFASLVSAYLDEPEAAKTPIAQIPLGNLYRLLEMFRYNAFADQNRSGVLLIIPLQEEWHIKIKRALGNALAVAYKGDPKDEAIDKIEAALKGLANAGTENGSLDLRGQAKLFFRRFTEELK
jgi:hypothetical protein